MIYFFNKLTLICIIIIDVLFSIIYAITVFIILNTFLFFILILVEVLVNLFCALVVFIIFLFAFILFYFSNFLTSKYFFI